MTRSVLRLILAASLIAGGARGLAAQEVVIFRAQQLRECGRLGLALDPAPGGLVVRDLIPGSPADRAGLRPGDLVVRIDDAAADPMRLATLSHSLQPGDHVRLRVRRAADQRTVELAAARDLCPQQVIVAEDPVVFRRTLREMDPGGFVIRLDTLRVDMDTVRIRAVAREASRLDSLRAADRTAFGDAWVIRQRKLDSIAAERRRGATGAVRRIVRTPSVVVVGEDGRQLFSAIDGFEIGSRAVAGAEFNELNPALAQYFQGADQGLLVLSVAPGTPSARAGLLPGDIVVLVNGGPVRTIGDLRLGVAAADRQPVALEVVRRGVRRELRLPLD